MAPRRTLASEIWPASLPLPLAFEVIRQHRSGAIREPRAWLEAIFGSASPAEIVRAAESQLAGEGLIDLSDWVMFDMPSHEARFIDDRSDVIRAALIGSLMTIAPDTVPRLQMGSNLTALRERVTSELTSLRQDEKALREDFGIADATEKLGRLSDALDAAYRDRTAREVEAVIAGDVDSGRAESLIRAALVKEWQDGFPRSIIADARTSTTEQAGRRYLGVRTLELKEFFLENRIEDETMELMGSTWARAFLDGEAEMLFQLLGRSSLKPRTWRIREVGSRLERAVEALSRRGFLATHLIGPASWRLWETLTGSSAISHGPRSDGGAIGRVHGLQAFEAVRDLSALVVMSLPAALSVEQRTFDGEAFRVAVRAVDDEVIAELRATGTEDVDGPGDSPEHRLKSRVLVDIREAPVFRINERAVVQVEIPEDLRERW